jgi:fibronectin type 3 domain-containing protein
MKSRLLLLEIVVGLFVGVGHLTAQVASPISLAWNASPSPDVTGYVVRHGTTSGVYSSATNVGNQTSASVTGLQAGRTYYLVVTARNAAGVESLPSNEATYQATTNLPVVTLTTPIAGANFQSPTTINLAASVTANGHTITKVQFLNGTTLLGEDAAAPYSYVWNNVVVGNYSLIARAIYDSGSTVTSSSANVAVTNPPPANGLTFAATSGVITAPFSINGGTLSQPVDTSLASGGRAVYTFNVITPGDYTMAVIADAPDTARNSFFVNIDGEPTDPYMVWHILPVTTGFQSRTVSWQGNGTVDSLQFMPKVFTLAAGTHQLIIRGREANARLGTITLTPVAPGIPPTIAPTIALTSPANGASYTSPATVILAANVTANGHSITKVQFFNGAALIGEATSSPYGFSWNNVGAGDYSLTARVVYDAGSTLASTMINVVVAGLSAPWQTTDIGSVGLTGSASVASGVYTISGAGQLTGTSDSLRFLYQPLSADGEIKARLTSVQTDNANCRFGVMIRDNLSPNSKYAFMGVSQDLKFRWQRRSSSGGNTASTISTASTPPNTWVRLVRAGSTITGYMSDDGSNWTRVNSRSISMATNVFIGFVAASGSTNSVNTAVFANGFVVP